MKAVFLSVITVLVFALAILSVQGKELRTIKKEVTISAPASEVWKVITDINSWKSWNPTVNAASGSSEVGSVLDITIRGEQGEDASKYQPLVIESEEPLVFRWRAQMMGGFVMKNDRVFELNEVDGKTILTHSEEFSGIMIPLVWEMLETFVSSTLEKMNLALKQKVEN